MIFVTVGNPTQGFSRLLEAVDELAGSSILDGEAVIIQSGNTDFHARHCTQRDFFPPEEFRDLISKAEVIVCHGGAGSLHHAFTVGKVPVVMPRRKQYGEHVDDQFEFVKAVEAEGRIIAAYEPEDLPNAVIKARSVKGTQPMLPKAAITLISEAIEQLCTFSV